MSRSVRRAVALGLAALCASTSAAQSLPAQAQVGFDQRLGARLPLDARFALEDGREIALGELFGRRPVVLAFVYYECPMLCGQVLAGLVRSLRAIPLDAGTDFEVVAVGIDPGETPALARAKRASCLEAYGRAGAEDGWHFLTGAEGEIRRVADAAGFRYAYDPSTDQYAHAAGLVVATPAGELSRYFFDVEFPARDLRLGIVEAGAGAVGTAIDQVLLFCFHYDPSRGRYSLAIWSIVRLAGLATVSALAGFVLRSLVREQRSKAARRREAAA